MEQIKHRTLPLEKTLNMQSLIGLNVLSKDGNKIGRIKSIHLHPEDLTVEGVIVDAGWFEANHYIGGSYIEKITDDSIILSMIPVTEYIGLMVHDSEGVKIGKIKEVNRTNSTNKMLSINVDSDHHDNDLIISSDYISAIGSSVMLKGKLIDLK